MLRLLIADGNTRDDRAQHVAVTGRTSAESYADVVHAYRPEAQCRLLSPADADAALPDGAALAEYDGVIFTGSPLKVGERSPAVTRQCDLMRAALEAGLPVFGSCWGTQLAAVVAGGDVGPNPRGPEYGFARRITATAEGRGHPLLSGRGAAWDAPAIHSDAVIAPPPGARVLAGNALLDVQAIEIPHGGGLFWGTQYHPELDFDELAAMLRVSAADVVEAGLAPDAAAVSAYAAEIAALHAGGAAAGPLAWRHGLGADVLEPDQRRREIGNFLDRLVERGAGAP